MGIWTAIIIVMVLSAVVQGMLTSRFNRYSATPCALSGAEVARRMLEAYGIHDVKVVSTNGALTDFYNPQNRTINLSEPVYGKCTIAAAAVAAHETGHAIQDYQDYKPLMFRSKIVPVVTFCNAAVMWVLLAGVLLIQLFPSLIWIGIAMFAVTTLFSFVTLPVEINASRRATLWLEEAGITDAQTTPMAKDALKWAAYTYVIAAISSLLTLFYYIGIARRR